MISNPDDFTKKFFERIPREVAESFDERQLSAVKMAFGGRHFGQHTVEIRRSIPLFLMRFYLVLLMGGEGRSLERRALDKKMRPLWSWANTAIVFTFLIILSGSIFGGLYTADSTFSFGIFSNGHSARNGSPTRWLEINRDVSTTVVTDAPGLEITKVESRAFGDSSKEELFSFKTDSGVQPSSIQTKIAGVEQLFVAEAMDQTAQIETLQEKGVSAFPSATQTIVNVYKDSAGLIIYAESNFPDNVKCVLAEKRLGEKAVSASEPGTLYFKALAEFRICSGKPMQEVMDIYRSVNLREKAKN